MIFVKKTLGFVVFLNLGCIFINCSPTGSGSMFYGSDLGESGLNKRGMQIFFFPIKFIM